MRAQRASGWGEGGAMGVRLCVSRWRCHPTPAPIMLRMLCTDPPPPGEGKRAGGLGDATPCVCQLKKVGPSTRVITTVPCRAIKIQGGKATSVPVLHQRTSRYRNPAGPQS